MDCQNFPKEALDLVEPKYRDRFVNFVNTGECEKNSDFERYMNNDKNAQEAFFMIAELQAQEMRELADRLCALVQNIPENERKKALEMIVGKKESPFKKIGAYLKETYNKYFN